MSAEKPKVIWLEPLCGDLKDEGRTWCEDNVWENNCECGEHHKPVKYVLAPIK